MSDKAPHDTRRGWAWGAAPPVVAFLAVNLVFFAAADFDGFDYLSADTWIRWDSFHYLSMADHGVTYEACTIPKLFDLRSTLDIVREILGFDVTGRDACGNAGWFPGYALLIRLVALTALGSGTAAVSLATGFQLATLAGLWNWFLKDRPRVPALLALTAAAFFFGHIYYRAAFPMSMTTFLILAHLHLMLKERWVLAGAAGALAAFTYPTAYLVAPISASWILLARRGRWSRADLGPAAVVSGLSLAGFGAVMVYQRVETGVWGAFFDVQAQFGYALRSPTTRLTRAARPVFEEGLGLATLPHLHTILVALSMTILLVVVVRRWTALTPAERWTILFIVPAWVFPLMLGGRSSLYRIESVLLPSVILLPRAPKTVQIASVALLGALSYPMALLFFRNELV